MSKELFPGRDSTIKPQIYAYTEDQYKGYYKVGDTTRDDVEIRVREQYPTIRPGNEPPYRIVFTESAMRADGSVFRDHEVHRMLESMHCPCVGGEWYKCTVEELKKAVHAVKNRLVTATDRTLDFKMRPEQEDAVVQTKAYYESAEQDGSGRIPKYLWNAKMRFGKTFAAYQLAKILNYKKILVLTFKPAVKGAWRDDLSTHVDFEGWQFISRPTVSTLFTDDIDEQYALADKNKPIVCFGSFQDLLGVDRKTGTIKAHNEWIHATHWDLVIFDEYHFGAWREKAKELFEKEDDEQEIERLEEEKYDPDSVYDESFLPISTSHYLFLSGTPFRAINSGEFIEEQIFSWTYSDEQRAKEEWDDSQGSNPYAALPRMVMLTYKMPEAIRKIAMQGEFNEFDLNVFFSTEGKKKEARFVFEAYVQKWLDLLRGQYFETSAEDLKTGRRSPFPFSDIRLRQVLNHTLWYMPSVDSCYAMKNLLKQKQNSFYHSYRVVVAAGSEAGQGAEAMIPVESAMEDPLKTQTITLTCGKLTTGVTVKPWTGIFMLRNLKQPESYFQAAFRVQSPWTAGKEIIKEECYVFDFAPNRTLRQLSEYSCRLNTKEKNPETKVGEFIKFLPVLSYEGNMLRQIDAGEILDIAMSGTSATLLARRWESALLVNVTNDVLARLLANPKALAALMSMEGFRNLNSEIETIINKSEEVKKAKKEGLDGKSKNEKKELNEAEKEYKSKRKEIQEKLIKFSTRIPIFMYLTDYREVTLQDVITKLEPGLFKKVTGLYVKDFELLKSIGLFNEDIWNDAIFKFRRYEEASLEYTGINKHAGEPVGGWSTVLTPDDYQALYAHQADYGPVIPETKSLPSTKTSKRQEQQQSKPVITNSDIPEIETPLKPKVVLIKKSPSTNTSITRKMEEKGASMAAETPPVAELRIGDKVQVDLYGVCVVNRFGKGCVYLKTKQKREVVFKYPHSLAIGSIKKL